jgi:ferric-chelate reductase (NADPH)
MPEVLMPPLAKFVTNTIEKMFFRAATIAEVRALTGHFREVVLTGENLKDVECAPGQTVQFHLGSLKTRTYTPMAWDKSSGSIRFLFFLHGSGPGSEWAATLREGDRCQITGPQDSLDLTGIKEPVLFFGDETSIAAAQALRLDTHRPDDEYFFEVSSLIESEEVFRCLGFTNARLFQRLPDAAHLSEVESVLINVSSRIGLPQWVFTGKAQSIQTLKNHLRARRMFFHRPRVRAYWAEGKTGLD